MHQEIVRAILYGDMDKFSSLLGEVSDINAVTEGDRWNLLHRALVSVSASPLPEMIKALIERGIDVNARDRYDNTPLHYAARSKKPELMQLLLDAGAEIDPLNRDGLTPLRLMLTTKPANLEAIELLLSRGANMNQKVAGGKTVKEYARIISHGDTRAIIELFDKYSDRAGTR
jgi:uncharacterized protein